MIKNHGKLTARERDTIALLRARQVSIRRIARELGRSPSSISDEIARNSFGDHYVAIHAQANALHRKSEASQRNPLKNDFIYGYTLEKLRWGWSPEQIAGRLCLEYPDDETKHIHHETIYRFIYAPQQRDKKLWEYLPRKQKKRKKKYGRKSHRVHIPDRVSIHERPAEVETRSEFGHWEGDSIEGKAHHGGIHTQVERKTRFMMAYFLQDLTAATTATVVAQLFRDLPNDAKKSTTVDNGREFVGHTQFGLPTYFADPYSSWQRGTNENSNGLVRRYLPKKTDFTGIAQSELDAMMWEINNKPKKCLGFSKPQEAFEKELQSIFVRIQLRT
jgi:IS30 family transposase